MRWLIVGVGVLAASGAVAGDEKSRDSLDAAFRLGILFSDCQSKEFERLLKSDPLQETDRAIRGS